MPQWPLGMEPDLRTQEILCAIEHELERASRPVELRVRGRRAQGKLWSLDVDADSSPRGLDEGLEGSLAWWKKGKPGESGAGQTADVLAVEPGNQRVHLQHASAKPPGPGHDVRLYPPRFLGALRGAWSDPAWAARILEIYDGQIRQARELSGPRLDSSRFGWLRAAQRQAFSALRFTGSFVFGPPGTGKTRTIGAVLASVLLEHPRARVLLLSTTNVAVDRALIAVDRALEECATNGVRPELKRLGQQFTASEYVGREHLLPAQDDRALRRLVRLERVTPDRDDVERFSRWRERSERARGRLRASLNQILASARLVATTTSRALFALDALRDRPRFDVIVFDEASQVSLAHALALLPIGKRALFAGDPQQLGPIVQTAHAGVFRWLGRSVFHGIDLGGRNVVFLDEQSRMATPICELVSQVFYGGRLRVAADAVANSGWRAERAIGSGCVLERAITTVPIHELARWSRRHRGPLRPASVLAIVELLKRLAGAGDRAVGDGRDLLILTPFRAQRALLRDALKHAAVEVPALARIAVSTVHRGQGDERHTVLFDPVDGASPWLQSEDAKRLLNVAFSRAKARLVVFLSSEDRRNPLLETIARRS